MYITGVGRTKFGQMKQTLPELMYDAMIKAMDDSEMGAEEIDAIYISNFLSGVLNKQLHLNSVIASLLPGFHKPIVRVESACASGGAALYQALLSLKHFRNVLVVGAEKMTAADNGKVTEALAMAGDRADYEEGLTFPAGYAMIAQQHMLKYGTTNDDLSSVSLKNHNNANLNPLAHFYYKKASLGEIKSSKSICTPFSLFDCCPVSDGAAALVLSSEKRNSRDVRVLGSAMAVDTISLKQRDSLASFASAKLAAQQAFRQANITPKDVDVAEVHDCFTIAELIAMEDICLCKPGESKEWIRSGRTELSGSLPINTDGGLIGDGHPIGASGIAQIIEIVDQLRKEAGKRQVDRAKTGLAHNIGGFGGSAVVHILRSD